MPEAKNKILNFTQNHKSVKIPFVIYADTESLLEKIQAWDNDPTKLFTSKINKHTAGDYSLFTHCSFDNNEKPRFLQRQRQCEKKTLTSDKETIEGKKPRKLTNNKSMKNLMNTKTTAMSEITAITQQNIGGTP